jgi:HAL2 family 3'(2'),5'-bisphosphate nucleotidase
MPFLEISVSLLYLLLWQSSRKVVVVQGWNGSDTLPIDLPRRAMVQTAIDAVYRACVIPMALQPEQEEYDTRKNSNNIFKDDLSPVTVADYAVQARILHDLSSLRNNEDDFDFGFIAEEDSTLLKDNPALLQQVARHAQLSPQETLDALDLGKSYRSWKSPNKIPSRIWCLDPIDGTRGFLRGRQKNGQYAIALALLEQGVPVIGVLGCPNLLVGSADNSPGNPTERGCLFAASQGGGSYQIPIHGSDKWRRLEVTRESQRSVTQARFCIGVEKYSDALGQTNQMAQQLHGTLRDDGEILYGMRMDSQAKHGMIARGDAELYVRLPKPGYIEWIWDHAAGKVVVEEAGGIMTDTEGQPLDFTAGPTPAQLSPQVRGVFMSSGGPFHRELVRAYQSTAKTTTSATEK